MEVRGGPWRSVEVRGGPRRSVEVYGGLWRSVEVYGGPWRSMEVCGGPWRSTEACGGPWRPVEATLNLLGLLAVAAWSHAFLVGLLFSKDTYLPKIRMVHIPELARSSGAQGNSPQWCHVH